MRFLLALQLVTMLSLTACAGGAGGSSNSGNDNGSNPINAQEERDYKRAINKCYKTGGSRVVKVEGQLMCY
ncbi:MAG: hypothetical protein EOP07_17835 [Proteobacteria bacterium]|nr:MAG: hypothetical protein EOP07_17835 [Pseudomonadota bacterium]